MANVEITATDRYTNTVEYTGAEMTALNDALEVRCHASEFTFGALVTGSANFKLALECGCEGSDTWFEIDTSKTINEAGEYVYPYSGRPSSRIRLRLSEISSGTPSIIPHIAVAYHG